MLQQVVITGAKRSKGEMEGRPYDSTKVYVQTKMDTNNVDMVGFATSEYTWGKADNFAKLSDLKFPLQAEIELELVTSGKSSKMIVIDVKPIVPPVKA